MPLGSRETLRSVGHVQTFLRYVRQTITDVRSQVEDSRQSAEFKRGWRSACGRCLQAFQDPGPIETTDEKHDDQKTLARGGTPDSPQSSSPPHRNEG